jgi:16S rRNA (guanine966-N2)-methyltransferase
MPARSDNRRGTAGPRVLPGSVRIIAGHWRGRRIRVPDGALVRPTPDRVRETLFNWLRDTLDGARCLDLYAGTGVLGFEALSRGAAEVTFVERDAALADALRAQAAKLGGEARIERRDVAQLLRERPPSRFDVVFLDPPFDVALEPTLELLPPWLADGALIYVERPNRAGLPELPNAAWRKRSRAGAVSFGLLAWPAQD